MAGQGEQAAPADSEKGSSSVKSPIKRPGAVINFRDPAAGSSKLKNMIEEPKKLATTAVLPELASADALAIGNKEYETMLITERRFGVFYKRTNTENQIVWATLNVESFRTSVLHTLNGVITRCLYNKGIEADANITTRVNRIAAVLVKGICVSTYNRLRAVNFGLETEGDRFIPKPKIPNPFEVPLPFAIAIQQLGAIEIVGLPNRTIAYPTAPTGEAGRFLLPQDDRFKTTEYAQAVEYCKSIGMQFASVDLSLKCGSAWWLFLGQSVDGVFQLTLPLPDSNFTEQDALMHLMFCATAAGTFGNPLFELGELNVGDHGYLLRNPQDDANINSYFAYSDEPLTELWKIDG